MVPPIFQIPTCLLVPILQWIDLPDLNQFDSAITNESCRKLYLEVLHDKIFYILKNKIFLGEGYFRWLISREIQVHQLLLDNIVVSLSQFENFIHQQSSLNFIVLKNSILLRSGHIKRLKSLTLDITESDHDSILIKMKNILDDSKQAFIKRGLQGNLIYNLGQYQFSNSILEISDTKSELTLDEILRIISLYQSEIAADAASNDKHGDELGLYIHGKFENGFFSKLFDDLPWIKTLNISENSSVDDDAISRLADKCPNLLDLNISSCSSVSDVGLIYLVERCSNLVALDVHYCHKLSDAAVMGLAVCCKNLRNLNLSYCYKVTDIAVQFVAEHCVQLTTFAVCCCIKLTDFSIIRCVELHPWLENIDLSGCDNFTDAAIMAIALCCNNHLQTVNISDNRNITDAALSKLVESCKSLQSLTIDNCPNISNTIISQISELNLGIDLHSMRY